MFSFRSFAFVCSSIALATACTPGMMASMTAVGRTPGKSPLAGEPLRVDRPSKSAPREGSSACTVWPLEDHIEVTATPAQLCIKGKITEVTSPSREAPEHPVSFTTDPAGDSIAKSTSRRGPPIVAAAGQVQGTTQKVGKCTPGTEVWVTTYDGCVPNKGTSEGQLLTAKSTFLDVAGIESWKF